MYYIWSVWPVYYMICMTCVLYDLYDLCTIWSVWPVYNMICMTCVLYDLYDLCTIWSVWPVYYMICMTCVLFDLYDLWTVCLVYCVTYELCDLVYCLTCDGRQLLPLLFWPASWLAAGSSRCPCSGILPSSIGLQSNLSLLAVVISKTQSPPKMSKTSIISSEHWDHTVI